VSSQDQTTTRQGTDRDESLLSKRIFETAKTIPSISRFVDALRLTQLDNDLLAPEYRTLFAPTNEALRAAPNDFWDELLTPENEDRLRSVVALHIVRGRQTLADLKTTATVKSIGGEPVKVSVDGAHAYFDISHIIRADIACTNGQIHLIDKLVTREYTYAG